MKRLLPLLLLAWSPGCAACPDADDAAAKERIWGSERADPRPDPAAERLDPDLADSDPALLRRILWMSAAETADRLASFESTTEVRFTWRRGGKRISLRETMTLEQSETGDFRVALSNDQKFGMELRWAGGKVYMSSNGGKFFERRGDRAGHLAWREESLGQLTSLLDLADGHVAFVKTGTATHQGRSVVVFASAPSPEPTEAAAPPPRPRWARDPVYPKNGPTLSLQNRLAVRERGKLVSFVGDLRVDEETGVVLAMNFVARMEVPPPDGADSDAAKGEPARLELRMERTVTGVGRHRLVDVPEHEPFSRRPRAVADPMSWWPKYVQEIEAKKAQAAADAAGGDRP